MSSVTYAIVFKGEILEGHQIISVKAHLAKLLKADADQIVKLFSGKQIVLKKTTDKTVALKYGTALKKVGADVKVRVIKSDTTTIESPATASGAGNAAEPTTTSTFSLVPNEGYIFDPAPKSPPVEVDVSDLSLAEPGAGFLVEPHEFIELDLDLSELNLSDPGAGMLAEPKPEVPKIEAPDFGLDEPGAMLETLREEVELLDPDTTGLTVAEPGADLLPDEEKQPAPEPAVPDTSSIHLVTDFG